MLSGGGNTENLQMNHSGPPLRWMAYEATSAGLALKKFKGEWNLRKAIDVHESLDGWFWRLLEHLPIPRLSYTNTDGITL